MRCVPRNVELAGAVRETSQCASQFPNRQHPQPGITGRGALSRASTATAARCDA